jgi:Flp pilus assembly protein TadB
MVLSIIAFLSSIPWFKSRPPGSLWRKARGQQPSKLTAPGRYSSVHSSVAVAVAVAVAVDVGVAVAVGVGLTVAVGVGVAVAIAVAVGVGDGLHVCSA